MTLPRGSIYKLCGLLLWLIGAIAASAWMAVHEEWILMSLCLIVGVVAVVKIIRFHFQNIRKLTYLFDSIENGDYAFKFTEYDGSFSDNMLNMSLNRIKDILVHARMETIQREKYYAEILDRVGTGVLVINAKGNVYQINRSALRMFGLPVVTHVNQLSVIDWTVSRTILALKSGEKRQLSFSTERGVSNLSVDASEMIVRDTPLRIIAMNDVHEELDEKENESWIRLIRILTHEIMNSVAPITSISDSLLSEKEQIPASAREGIEVIRTTSRGLVRFVESYRQLTRIPAPNCRPFYLRPFLERMRTLALQGQEKSVPVSIEIDVEPTDLLLYADEEGRLRAWGNRAEGRWKGECWREGFRPYAFSGVHVLQKRLIQAWAEKYGRSNPFSVIDAYLSSIPAFDIRLEEHTGGFWKDMGKIEDFQAGIPLQ